MEEVIMDSRAENALSVNSSRQWVKFEAEETKNNGADLEAHKESEAAVLTVENGPKPIRRTAIVTPTEEPQGAVIEATQEHVNVERRAMAASPVPNPAPRSSKESLQSPPKAAARSRSTPLRRGTPANNDTVIPIQTRHELQSVPLSDTTTVVNGSVSTGIQDRHNNSATSRRAFANGDVIATLLPLNATCPWITRAGFRPEFVPEELMSQHLTLTVEEYLSAMEVLVNDFRFNCYNICYKRILLGWLLLGFLVLLALLFSGIRGLHLFGAGVIWLFLNASGIFLCMWIKIKLRYHLEHCLAQVNKYFIKHKILLGVDDRGKLSCHKVHLIFIYFDCNDCVKKLNQLIEREDNPKEGEESEGKRSTKSFHARMDIDDSDIIITGSTNTRLSRQQERGERLLLRYCQRWVKEFVCKRLDLCVDVHDRTEGDPPAQPRHCVTARCPCQFIEEHLHYKPRGRCCGCHFFDF